MSVPATDAVRPGLRRRARIFLQTSTSNLIDGGQHSEGQISKALTSKRRTRPPRRAPSCSSSRSLRRTTAPGPPRSSSRPSAARYHPSRSRARRSQWAPADESASASLHSWLRPDCPCPARILPMRIQRSKDVMGMERAGRRVTHSPSLSERLSVADVSGMPRRKCFGRLTERTRMSSSTGRRCHLAARRVQVRVLLGCLVSARIWSSLSKACLGQYREDRQALARALARGL